MREWNERDAYIDTVFYRNTGRIPLCTFGPRESTLKRWEGEGMEPGGNWFVQLCNEVGIPYIHPTRPRCGHGVDFRMIPQFEEKVIEHRDGHFIVQDWMGNITEISDAYDVTYIRSARDFVTRKWHGFPVSGPADFPAMKRRYDPGCPGRFPQDFAGRCQMLKERDYVLSVSFPGPFWQMREWCGFEPLCMMFLEDPGFIEEMVGFWSGFVAEVLARTFRSIVPDKIHIQEDMAYKGASMISPAMARKYLLPVWTRWSQEAHSAGVPIVDMDSDGYVGELIPLWREAGIDLCDPIEAAAGNDLGAFMRTHGRSIAYAGGIDKRAMAAGGAVLEREMERIGSFARGGGFLPGCDHGIPPDVSWPNMRVFMGLWGRISGWI